MTTRLDHNLSPTLSQISESRLELVLEAEGGMSMRSYMTKAMRFTTMLEGICLAHNRSDVQLRGDASGMQPWTISTMCVGPAASVKEVVGAYDALVSDLSEGRRPKCDASVRRAAAKLVATKDTEIQSIRFVSPNGSWATAPNRTEILHEDEPQSILAGAKQQRTPVIEAIQGTLKCAVTIEDMLSKRLVPVRVDPLDPDWVREKDGKHVYVVGAVLRNAAGVPTLITIMTDYPDQPDWAPRTRPELEGGSRNQRKPNGE